jgi:hypothetical protein
MGADSSEWKIMTTATATKTRKAPAPRKVASKSTASATGSRKPAVKAAKATTAVKAATGTPKAVQAPVKAVRPRMPKPMAEAVLWDAGTDLVTATAEAIRYFGSVAQHSPRTKAGKDAATFVNRFEDKKSDIFWAHDRVADTWHLAVSDGKMVDLFNVDGSYASWGKSDFRKDNRAKFTEYA